MITTADDEVETYLSGKCFALAYALHVRMGWPIEAKIERLPDGTEYAAHVWVVAPDGRAIDAEGPAVKQSMIAAYGSSEGEVRRFDREDFIEFCEVDDDDELDSFWEDVEEAADFLERHLKGVLDEIEPIYGGGHSPEGR